MNGFSKETFAKRLHDLRIDRRITQKKLAEDLGVTDMTISRYESGSVEPNIDTIYKISNYFGVGISYLFGEKENNPKERAYYEMLDMYSGALMPSETASEAFVQILNLSPLLKDQELRTIRDYFSFLLSQRKDKKDASGELHID